MAAARSTQTWSLTEHLLATQKQLYESATQHPFLLAGAEGRLPKDVLSRWLANDRLYIHSYIRAAGKLLAQIDLPQQVARSEEAFETQLADWLIEALVAIRKEERFFIDVADRYGLGIDIAVPFPPSHAAAQTTTPSAARGGHEGKLHGLVLMESIFLSIGGGGQDASGSPSKLSGLGQGLVQAVFSSSKTTTATPPPVLPWLEGALTFWGTERCYLDAWSWARDKAEERGQPSDHDKDADGGALRREFIPNWSSPEFAEFVDKLGKLVDSAVAQALEGEEGEGRDNLKADILARVEGKWKTLLEAEKQFWPDV